MDTTPKPQDQTLPNGKWEFDKGVTAVFDDMLSRSIPQYELMRATCLALAQKFRIPRTDIVDLGCSRGEALAPLIDIYGAHNRFIGVEIADAMHEAATARFKGWIDAGYVDIKKLDLRVTYPPAVASVTLCILTLQFTPIEHRLRILSDVYNHTLPGGALILVEKVLGNSAPIDGLFVEQYLNMKRSNGYTEEQIQRKKLSLEGVLVPVTAKWNEEMLHSAGFKYVDCFWRWMNFGGWIAVK